MANKKKNKAMASSASVKLTATDIRKLVLEQYDDEFKDAVHTFIDRSGSPPIVIDGKPVTAEESFRNFLAYWRLRSRK